ncbi:MAG: YDG domain-containing protein [Peptococcaceae bacterium]|jgi:hypothetical protein|nr:YDG domain-containing protein [Peptococcaceae bacterium]
MATTVRINTLRKGLALLLALALTISLLSSASAPALAVGYGADGKFLAPIGAPIADSIAISDRAGLEAIANNLSGNYHLTADIDLSGEDWVPIGSDMDHVFSGIFDGQGHIVRNLRISGEGYDCNGLFGEVNGAAIKNVGLEGTDIDISSKNYDFDSSLTTGGIAGFISESSSISNCYNTGNISSSSSHGRLAVGGIVGHQINSSISDCYNTGKIQSSSSGNPIVTNPSSKAGGIAGHSFDYSSISNCYNTGEIFSSWHAGGIAGRSLSTQEWEDPEDSISNCVVLAASINATNTNNHANISSYLIGGSSDGLLNKTGNLSLPNINGNAIDDASGYISDSEARQQSIYDGLGWDFDTIWSIDPSVNDGYPYLGGAHPTIITITGVTAESRAYDGTTDVALSGGELLGVLPEDQAGDGAVGFTLGVGSIESANAGAGKPVTTNIALTGARSVNYKLTQPDDITVDISKAAGPAAPAAVTGAYTGDGEYFTYTIDTIPGAEYSEDNASWRDSPVFGGFTTSSPATTFYARIKETANYLVGAAVAAGRRLLPRLPPAWALAATPSPRRPASRP